AEAYRTLRTNIQFERMERGGKVLVVTSPTLQEGKTTTIVNLALTMAQNGQKTLLVGGNMRRPSIHRFFGIEREPGLSDILVGKADAVLPVYQAGKVGRLVLKRAKAHLESARAQVWGVVLNDLQTEVSGYTYTHYYTHYYGEETPGEPPRGGGGRVQRAVDRAR